ncbi:MAG TPA: TRAP transporter large permease [Bacillota bacterium]|nr:TRAP transporter large permease [Clostridiaceae bacterium]HNR05280.1 TRAP transporter large permease [Bacillota bacterium]HPL99064.1 TRAP transporter large permease [Bacillota bacterium]HPX68847.1 TRAP transporter large permease [Bacillota bacterium]HQA64970.1 TRAP transporter large permease [Bacillota bacterium]
MALWIFVVFLSALVFAVPIAVSMVIGAMTPLFLGGTGSSIQQLIANSFSGSDTTPILAVPLFILGGVLMAEGGISRRLFNFFAYFVGNLTGGLPCAVILTCLFYGAISGSGPATTAAVGSMTIPFLVDMGYDKTWSAGMVATAGGLGVIIPPSIPFVLYSLATGVSTGALFLGGVLPGILIGLCMMVYAVIYCKRKGENKERINAKMTELRSKGFLSLLKESFWALLSPVIVLGGIYSGIVTPTEAACISVFYSLFVSLIIYKSFTIKEIIPFLGNAVKTYAPLCFVLAFAIAFGRVLALAKAPILIENFILNNFSTSITALTGIVVVFLLLGMVMDTGPAIVILSPILLPAVQALGVDPVHFGVIMVCCLSIGLATPPFGLDLFVAGTLSSLPPMKVAMKAMPFIIAFGIALFIITYIPWFSLVFL